MISDAGFQLLPGIFSPSHVARWIAELDCIGAGHTVRSRGGVYAVRNLLRVCPPMRELANSAVLRQIVETNLASGAFAVRGTLFDKVAGANWLVPLHQDLTISVADRSEVEGYG